MKFLKTYKIFESNVNSIIDEYLQNCKWDIKNSIGNCAFFSKDFYEWCQSKGIECKLMYLKQDNLVSDEIEDHIIPMVDGKLIKREDGKVLKPDTFVQPNIKKAMGV